MGDEIVRRLKQGELNEEYDLVKNPTKPWGGEIHFPRNTSCTPKLLLVKTELSCQSHRKRDEIWCLASGKLAVFRGEIEDTAEKTIAGLKEKIMLPGDNVFIPKNTVHAAVNLGEEAAVITEISLGIAEEDDIERYYDINGRVRVDGYPYGISIVELIALCRKKTGL